MSFIAGSSYASFERIRHMHVRHHVDRADLACFNFQALLRRRPGVRRTIEALEWAYLPATEILMHLQVVWRPFFVAAQRRHLPRAAAMLVVRGVLLALLGLLVAEGVDRVSDRRRAAAARAEFLRRLSPYLPAVFRRRR